ncbi:nucleotidyltransferase family protein [Reyranella sp.]|uniref:nucleotidyltransferase family protein n=1 Tax=Reyranella sp. TaxID=1929291 RepID=UPI002726485D|nr:nucleotidyltransferase family protein [Reyranella sp.]MDO8974415.1 nucleotidyltransferase family protein [Reyranella sp.]
MSLIARIIAEDALAMEQLRAVRELALPDWCIAAGFVRNRVWDHLHGIVPARLPVDIDVLYFDAGDVSRESEAAFERRLEALLPGLPWQVRNQARMHVWKDLPPHLNTADSMIYWLETVTGVGVRLEADDTLTVIAPLGTDDLLNLRCRPTPYGRTRRHEYDARVEAKRWRDLWPGVAFLD